MNRNTHQQGNKNSKNTVERPSASIDRRTLESKLGFRVRLADRAVYKEFVQTVGMTPVQYSVLTLVAENEGTPQGVIGETLNMDRASTTAVMDKLEKAGLIERKKSPDDRRRHALYMTLKGKKKIVAIEKKVQMADGKFKNKLTDKQLRELIAYLDIICEERENR